MQFNFNLYKMHVHRGELHNYCYLLNHVTINPHTHRSNRNKRVLHKRNRNVKNCKIMHTEA